MTLRGIFSFKSFNLIPIEFQKIILERLLLYQISIFKSYLRNHDGAIALIISKNQS